MRLWSKVCLHKCSSFLNHLPLISINEEEYTMKAIGVLLIILGIIGLLMGMMMFGDIGVAAIIGALAALLSGIGFLSVNRRLTRL